MEFNSDVQCGDNKNYSSTILFICNNGVSFLKILVPKNITEI